MAFFGVRILTGFKAWPCDLSGIVRRAIDIIEVFSLMIPDATPDEFPCSGVGRAGNDTAVPDTGVLLSIAAYDAPVISFVEAFRFGFRTRIFTHPAPAPAGSRIISVITGINWISVIDGIGVISVIVG